MCAQILADVGFSTVFSFNLDEQINLEADHIRAYKHLWNALWQFIENGGELDLLAKPTGAHKWIEAQKEIERARDKAIAGQQESEDTYISEVETEDSDSDQEGGDNGDDGLILNVDIDEDV